MTVLVVDDATKDVLFTCTGTDCDTTKTGSAALRSSLHSGMTVSYSWISAGDNERLKYGMRAAWRAVCSAGGRDIVSGDLLKVSIDDSHFLNNSCSGDGGGVSVVAGEVFSRRSQRSVVSIDNSLFESNVAGGSGGAVFAPSRLSVEAHNISAWRNVATTGEGGCMFLGNESAIVVHDSVCALNRGSSGGGIVVGAGATLELSMTQLLANSATETGGALKLGHGTNATFSRCNVTANSAATGGGCTLLAGASLAVQNSSTVAANTAASSGGAFALFGRGALSLSGGSVIARNSAFLGGMLAFGNVEASRSAIALTGIALQNNSASAGALYGIMGDSSRFPVPECSSCVIQLAEPLSYGPVVATPPVRYALNLTSGNALRPDEIHPGDQLNVGLGALLCRPPGGTFACYLLAQPDFQRRFSSWPEHGTRTLDR